MGQQATRWTALWRTPYRTRVGPRWYSGATGQPICRDDAAFLRQVEAHPQAGVGARQR